MAQPTAEEKLWLALSQVPRSHVIAYGALASLAGLPGRARWAGRALSTLPADTRLPWHRVINAGMRISFAPGSPAFERQRQKLEAEGVTVSGNGRVHAPLFGADFTSQDFRKATPDHPSVAK
ncbi:MGMT family protein [Thalassolituus sp.]|uniref:MGMT family protein n=1 Tax=Thalassolituus sp. TaxID=2030822 RepID=UPI003513B22A